MTPDSTTAAITAAELRVVQSRLNVRQSVDSTRSVVRTVIAKPSSLVIVALVAGVSAFLFTPRRPRAVKSVPGPAQSTIKESSRSLLRTLISLYGGRLLTMALQFGTAATAKKTGASDNAELPGTSFTRANTTPSIQ